jgi:hypothetical protein
MDDTMQRAIAAVKAGDKATGQRLLSDVIAAEPRNVEAMRWMAKAQDDPAERDRCWERVLDLDPLDKEAARALDVAPLDWGSGPGSALLAVLAVLAGLAAWLFVSQATLGVAVLACACLCGILARLAQADHHQKNLLRMLHRIRKATS